jgi:ubiquinone/menaquinone biosynthesis C-methylase UbiE
MNRPGYTNSHIFYLDELEHYITKESRWLDVGCGNRIIPTKSPEMLEKVRVLKEKASFICGVDRDMSYMADNKDISHLIVGDITKLPFPDNTFTVVTASMVVEHLECPIEALREIKRVLMPGGFFIFHTVNIFSYAGIILYMLPAVLKNHILKKKGGNPDESFKTFYRMNNIFSIKKNAATVNVEIDKTIFCETALVTYGLGNIFHFFESCLIRILRCNCLRFFRTNLVVVLKKK